MREREKERKEKTTRSFDRRMHARGKRLASQVAGELDRRSSSTAWAAAPAAPAAAAVDLLVRTWAPGEDDVVGEGYVSRQVVAEQQHRA
jgi:hypothetical protein